MAGISCYGEDLSIPWGLYKKTLLSWETDSQNGLAVFEFSMKTDHCCFRTVLLGAAHSARNAELKDVKSSVVCCVVR